MFFIKVGKLICHLIFWVCLLQILMGLGLVFSDNSSEQLEAASRRYFGGNNIGEEIDQRMLWLLGAVVLGIIAEIGARIVRAPAETDQENG